MRKHTKSFVAQIKSFFNHAKKACSGFSFIKNRTKSLKLKQKPQPLEAVQAVNKRVRKFIQIAAGVIFVVVVAYFTLSRYGSVITATYTFVQTDWSGGADTVTVPSHPGNQTGWNKYFALSNLDVSSGLRLVSTAHSTVDGNPLKTDGVSSSTNGGFLNGNFTSLMASGTGAAMSITLFGTTTVVNAFVSSSPFPVTPGYGFYFINANAEDSIYAIAGGAVGDFYKYSISNDTWTQLATAPGTGHYASTVLLRNGGEDYVYELSGNSSDLLRYSISGNSWTTLPAIPTKYWGGTVIRTGNEDGIYVIPADSGSRNFYRYSIAGNNWTTLTQLPAVPSAPKMIHQLGDDAIYVLTGGTTFYRYSISGNSWTTLTAVPQTVGIGVYMIRDYNSDTIYVLPGGNANGFLKYSISGNSWTTLQSVPVVYMGTSPALLSHEEGSNYIYGYGSPFSNSFMRYTISRNVWDTLQPFPGPESNTDGGLVRVSSTPIIFQFAGNTSQFNKFLIDETQTSTSGIFYIYSSSGSFVSAPINVSGASFTTMSWVSSTPAQAGSNSLRLQIATSTDGVTFSTFTGPSGPASYYTSSPANIAGIGSAKYIRYQALFSTVNTRYSPTLYSVTFNYSSYATTGAVTSSIYDTADSTNVVANLRWAGTVPGGTTLRLQLRSGTNTTTLSSNPWIGPDGTSGTYFTNGSDNAASIPAALKTNSRYVQYKAYFDSPNGTASPSMTSTTITYVVNAPPEIQNATAVQNVDGSVTINYEIRDLDTAAGTINPGVVYPSFKYWNGSGYVSVSTMAANATSSKAVNSDGVTWNSYSTTWYPKADFNNQNTTTAKIQITINDNEAANNTVVTTTPVFALDTQAPANASATVDASTTPATIFLSASDTSAVQYRLSLNSNLSGAVFAGIVPSVTMSLPSNPTTVYAQFQDGFSNTTTIILATTPESPTSTVIQDVSNLNAAPPDYRLFIAWKVVALPSAGFGSYKVWRSLNQSSWSLVGTVPDRTVNYFMDSSVASGTLYYYRITAHDSLGNGSYPSVVVNGRADGIQNAGEGGGGTALAPAITNVTSTSLTPTQATITWDTDQLSNSIVGYSQSAGVFTNTVTVSSLVNAASGVGQHTVIVNNLTPNTTYYFRVGSTNATNATSYDSSGGSGYTFTTINGPIITGVPSTVTVLNTSAVIAWTTNIAANSAVFFSTDTTFASALSTSTAALNTNHSVVLTGLTPNTRYYYYVRSADGSGNTEYDKNVANGVVQFYNFVTTNNLVAPTFSNFNATPATSSVIVAWTTDKAATSQVDYGPTASYGSQSSLDTTLTTQHAMTLTGLTPGATYHWRALSRDANGNLGTSIDLQFTLLTAIDYTPPAITSIATSSVGLTYATITWNTLNQNANGWVDYSTNSNLIPATSLGNYAEAATSHSVSLTNLSGNTTYYYRVNSTGALNNVTASSSVRSFVTVRDSTPPVISGVSAVASQTGAAVSWYTDKMADGRVDYGLTTSYGTTVATSSYSTGHAFTITGLTNNQTYRYRVVSVDQAGNSTIDDNHGNGYSFTTVAIPDTSLPQISNVAASAIALNSAIIVWNTDKFTNGWVDYGTNPSLTTIQSVGNYAESAQSHSVTLSSLSGNTTYYYRVHSSDSLGNTNSSTIQNFTTVRDNTPPVISNVFTIANQTAAIVDWSTDKPASSIIEYGTTLAYGSTASSSELVYSHSVPVAGLANNVTYYFRVTSVDLSGNISAPYAGSFKTIAIPDTAPPVISAISVSSITQTSATITWTTDKNANSTVNFGTTTAYGTLAGNATALVTSHSVNLTGLSPGTAYHFTVTSIDATGNSATSADNNFTTAADTSHPVISGVINLANQTSAVISWNTNKAADSRIDYGLTARSYTANVSSGALVTGHSMQLQSLAPSTTYYYKITSADQYGNTTVDDNGGADYFFTTLAVPDTTPPVISNIAVSSITQSGATVTWTTSKVSNSTVNYGLTSSYNLQAGNAVSLVSNHNVTLSGLAPNTQYHFNVTSIDSAGNTATSSDQTFTTQANTTKPIITTHIALANQTSAVISWNTDKSADSQVDYGTSIAYGAVTTSPILSTVHSVFLSSLVPNTTYYYKMTVVDQYGNTTVDDNGGSGYTFQTLSVPDTIPPVFTTGPTVSSLGLNQATIIWRTDKLTNGTVDFGTSLSYGSLAGSLYDFSTNTHSVTLSNLLGNRTYYFRANSMDISANSASANGSFITIRDTNPPIISVSSTLVNDTAAFVNWNTVDQVGVPKLTMAEVDYGTTPGLLDTIVAVTSTYSSSHSLPLTGLSPDTVYYYQIITADQSANTTTLGGLSLKTSLYGATNIPVTSTPPQTSGSGYTPPPNYPPAISNIRVVNITPYGATVTWDTDKEANSLLRYGRSTNYGGMTGDYLNRAMRHSVVLTNLLSGTLYHFTADSFDASGNLGSSGDMQFITLNSDGTVQTATSTPSDAGSSELVDQVRQASVDLVTQIINALFNNPYLKQVSEEQLAKMVKEMSDRIASAPTIVGLKPVVEVHGNNATIRWSTDKKTTGLVSYAKESDFKPSADKPYTTTVVDSEGALSAIHTVDLTNLDPGTLYHFVVSGKGEIGPEAKSKDYTFQTEAVLPIITDPKVTDVTESTVTVSWKTNIPTDAVLEYTNTKTNVTLTQGDTSLVTLHGFTVKDLDSGTPYRLVIKAKNETGNEADSPVLTFTTTLDTLPPKILNLSSNSTLYPGANSKVQTIISWETDKPATAQVFYEQGVGTVSTTSTYSTSIDTNPTTRHIVVLTNFKPGTVYKYWVESTSTAGNHTQSDIFSVLTPVEKQTIFDIIGKNFQSVFGWTKNLGVIK